MRYLITLMFITLLITASGQSKSSTKVSDDKVMNFIDSLKVKLFNDTIKFDRKNLIHSNLGTRNTKSYSSLFIVNMRYEYLLDIVDGQLVNEFIVQFLNVDKIQSINIVDTHDSQTTFGSKGVNGVIFIELKKGVKRRYDVAGLEMKRKGPSNNFAQRKAGELKIVY